MNETKWKVAVIVVAIIALLGNFFPFGKVIEKVITENPVGGVSTLDNVDNPYVNIAGVQSAYISQGLAATSSTICSIKNPYSGTSTVLALSLNITSGILGANSISVSTSTDGYATSTQFFVLDHSVASAATDSFGWRGSPGTTTNVRLIPTSATGETRALVGPNERVNYRLATTTGAGALAAYYQGQCSVVFEKL